MRQKQDQRREVEMIASYDPHFVRVQSAAAQFFPREPHGVIERERKREGERGRG